MTWLERVRSLLRREPVPDEHRATIQRADRLLARADRVIRQIRRVEHASH